MPRTLHPELLDSLPPDHPDAVHSRRDLRLINRIMGNHRWFARTLPPLLRTGERTLELGAGTGELTARLAACGTAVDGLDFIPRPPDLPAAHAWHVSDLRTFSGYERYAAVIANLILHHLTDAELATLGARLSRSTRLILASEPRRSPRSRRLFAFLAPLFRTNHVTLHDADVSIMAGFRGDELPRALGLDPTQWNCRCTAGLFGSYRLIAMRRP
jgi:2-polyprenyl-3-methyl-5-hydroxy-6-metoxy-1,4-benzoquinol methylase